MDHAERAHDPEHAHAHAQMQAQARMLRDVGRRHLDEEDAERWAALIRPGVRLAVADEEWDAEEMPTAARLGGLPRLHDGTQWPTGPDGVPLAFVAAVDCAALPAGSTDLPLPADGVLAFFASTPPAEGRVLYIPVGEPGGVRPAPPGAAVFPAVRLIARPGCTAPFPDHPRVRETFGLHTPQDLYDHPVYGQSFLDELAEYGHRFEHRVGGYAVVSGVAEYRAAAGPAGSPAVTDPAAATARDIARALEWVPLAQFHHEPAEAMPGHPDDPAPAGRRRGALVWLIREEDLTRGEFDAALLVPGL
ncbi:DUF1963 domain-containing protein [Streptomyces yangpuensis]